MQTAEQCDGADKRRALDQHTETWFSRRLRLIAKPLGRTSEIVQIVKLGMKKKAKRGSAPHGYYTSGYPKEYYVLGSRGPDEGLMLADTKEQAQFHGYIGVARIKDLLRTESPRFAVKSGGDFRWIDEGNKFRVWKRELLSHVIDPQKGTFRLEEISWRILLCGE